MAKVDAEKFLECLRNSGLVEADRLQETLDQWNGPEDRALLADPERLGDRLIEAGLITRWQCDKLLDGRSKGFFLKGKYKLLSHLGTGGMSSVYLAENVLMQRRVAVKVLPQSRIDDSSYLARFYLEAQAAAALDHRNIVRAYDIDEDGKNHFIVMEYVEGRDLQAMVKEGGPMEFDTAAEYIRQAASGLAHAHEAGLIHRDIKPANLLVDTKGIVKILDMGLARFSNDSRASLTIAHDENVLGTADYLPPEQAVNSHTIDSRADIYSLGCTLYYLLTGHPPFNDGTLAQRILKHQTQAPPSIYVDRADAPKELVDICLKMMAKTPARRFATAGDLSSAISGWLASRGKVSSGSSGNLGAAMAGERNQAKASGLPPPRRSPPPIPPPRPERAPRPNEAQPSTGDTVSSWEQDTIKGVPNRRPPVTRPTRPGDSGKALPPKGAAPPRARRDDRSDSDESIFDIGPTRQTSRSGAFPQHVGAEGSSRIIKKPAGAPWWVWVMIGGGLVLAVILAKLVFRN